MLALVLVSSWEVPKDFFVHSFKYQGFFIVELWCLESGRTFPWQPMTVMFIYWVAGSDSVSSWHFRFFLLFFSPAKICFSQWKQQQHLAFYYGKSKPQFNSIQLFHETCLTDSSLCGAWKAFALGSGQWEDDLQSWKANFRFYSVENDVTTTFWAVGIYIGLVSVL